MKYGGVLIMKMNKFFLTTAALMSSVSLSVAMVDIQIQFSDIGGGGVGGSGFSDSQAQAFFDAEATWESLLVDYAEGVTGPDSIVVTASAPAIDGAGGVLGQAGPTTVVNSGGFVFASSGIMEFDIADVNALEQSGDFAGVILHELGHVLGIGTLWEANGVYVNDSFQYTGASALERFQRDFDPDATFVPVESEGGPGTANAHWDEGTGLVGINPDTDYFGESLDDELLTGSLSGSLFISDVTLGSFEDIGYQVNFLVEDELFWDAGNTTSNGSIDAADGVWDRTNNNWVNEEGTSNSNFTNRATANFTGIGSTVTIAGVVNPSLLVFEVDGYNLTGGTIDITSGGASVIVTNAGDTATFNTTVIGGGALNLEGLGTVENLGSIQTDVNVTSGVLTSVADGFGDSIALSNESTVTIFGDDTIDSYESAGGVLNGSGTLTASTYTLSDGALVTANLGAGALEVTSGNVQLAGTSAADSVAVSGGTLAVSVNGLSSSASVSNEGTLRLNGDLTIDSYIASGGTVSGNGILSTNTFSGGTIQTTATGPAQLSLLLNANGGDVTLGSGSTLDFSFAAGSDLGIVNIFPLINNASDIVGVGVESGFENFILSGLPSGARGFFDVTTGELFVSSANGVPGISSNSAAVFNGLIDTDATSGDAFINVDGASSDTRNIFNTFASLGNAAAIAQLRELSPEVYGSVIDYGVQTHLSYLDAGLNTHNVLRTGKMRVFAGLNGFDTDSDSSRDDADFNIQNTGGYLGVARQINKKLRVGVLGAAETGEISGRRLDLDADGQLVALFIEREYHSPIDGTIGWGRLRGSVSYSDHSFDGSRRALGEVNSVDDIDSSVFQIGVDYKAELFGNKHYKVSPFVGLRYVAAEADGFTERGSVNNLSVDDFDRDSVFLEYGLDGRWMPNASNWGFTGSVKAQHTFLDDETEVSATFPGAASSFTVDSPGLTSFKIEARAGMFFEIGNSQVINFSAFTNLGDDYDSSAGGNIHYEIEW